MSRRHYYASALTMIGALAWSGSLWAAPSPWTAGAGGVIAAGLLLAGAVAVAALLLQSSPLGYWLAVAVAACEGVLALARPVSAGWTAGVVVMAASGVALADPSLGGHIRRQPLPAPIPRAAIALCLLLLSAGPITALAAPGTRGGLLPGLTGSAWLLLLAYVRLFPGREWWPRLGAPLLVLAGLLLSHPARPIWIALLLAASWLAWTKASRLAARPLIERGRTIPIPPELAPAEVLGAAGLDRQGRRQPRQQQGPPV